MTVTSRRPTPEGVAVSTGCSTGIITGGGEMPKSELAADFSIWGKVRELSPVTVTTRFQLLQVLYEAAATTRRTLVPETSWDLEADLLSTAEKDTGLPCSTSWLLHGRGDAPKPIALDFWDETDRRIGIVTDLLSYNPAGTTLGYVAKAFGDLARQIGGLRVRGLPLTAADLDQLGREAERLALFLLLVMRRLQGGAVPPVEYFVATPAHASSPCGVLRLAVPLVPNAPGRGLFFGPTDLVLAA